MGGRRCGAAVLERAKAFTRSEIEAYLAAVGDSNAIHQPAEEGRKTPPVVPGMLVASLFPALVGSEYPGALHLRQGVSFRGKVYEGQEVVARVEEEFRAGRRARFKTEAFHAGRLVADGQAHALLPSSSSSPTLYAPA